MANSLNLLAGRDVLLDTNLLLLEIVGAFDSRLIGRGRLDIFTADDFKLLHSLISQSRKIFTTPGVLTETNNLAAQIVARNNHSHFLTSFALAIHQLDERFESSAKISEHPAFLRLGLTDAGIAQITQKGMIVLTDDRALAGFLDKNGIQAVNFNYLRAQL